jgi:hypothetical protein
MERGAWSLELGAWSLEHGAWSESNRRLNTDLRKNRFTEPPSSLPLKHPLSTPGIQPFSLNFILSVLHPMPPAPSLRTPPPSTPSNPTHGLSCRAPERGALGAACRRQPVGRNAWDAGGNISPCIMLDRQIAPVHDFLAATSPQSATTPDPS